MHVFLSQGLVKFCFLFLFFYHFMVNKVVYKLYALTKS